MTNLDRRSRFPPEKEGGQPVHQVGNLPANEALLLALASQILGSRHRSECVDDLARSITHLTLDRWLRLQIASKLIAPTNALISEEDLGRCHNAILFLKRIDLLARLEIRSSTS